MASGTGIGEFFVSIGVDAAQGEITVGNLVQSFGELEIATLAEIGLLWEMGVALAKVVDEGMKASLGFEQFTMHTGLSAQELQKWQIIAQQSHASAEDVTSSVEALTKHLANLAVGIPDSALASLQQLGISAFGAGGKLKDAFQIFGEIQQRLGVISKDAGQQERILAGLGISPNLRETMLLAKEQAEALAATAHGMNEDQEKSFDSMRQHFVNIGLIAKDIGIDIGAWVANIDKATGSMRALESFFRSIRNVLEKGFTVSPETEAKSKEISDRNMAFFRALFNPNPSDRTGRQQLEDWFPKLFGNAVGPALSPEPVGGFRQAPAQVNVDKHDTYIIHDAHNPEKVKEVMERHWDETLQKKTIDGFDRQNGNGGY